MSTVSELKARFGPRVQTRAIDPVVSGSPGRIALRAEEGFTNTVGGARALRRRGVTLSVGLHAVERLVERKAARVSVPHLDDALVGELAALKIDARVIGPLKAADLQRVRAGLGMSQHQFADTYGLNPRTLQKWETKDGELDGAVSLLVKLIEAEPELAASLAAQ